METKELVVVVPKAAGELAEGLKNLGLSLEKALEDGWQTGQDLPVVVTAVITELLPKLQEVKKLGEEGKLDPVGVAQAFANAGMDIAKAFMQKPAAPVAPEAPAPEAPAQP